jgi:predicted phosphodiesterase
MTDPFRLAILSDVHGNRWALEAVLRDLERRSVDDVVNLGDSLYGPLDPVGTHRLLCDAATISVRGNQDRAILEQREDESSTMRFVQANLDDPALEWLAAHRAEAATARRPPTTSI